MITIRPSTETDVPVLFQIQREAFLPLYHRFQDPGSPALRGMEDVARRLQLPFRQYTILENGEIAGGLFYRTQGGTPLIAALAPGEYYLTRIYIHPALQAQGIGRQAILLCEQEFPDAKAFYVDFPAALEKNRRCYEAAGFRPTGRTITLSPDLTLLLYEKRLG